MIAQHFPASPGVATSPDMEALKVTQWSLSFLVGMWVGVPLLLIAIGSAIGFVLAVRSKEYHEGCAAAALGIGVVSVSIAVPVLFFTAFPFQTEYLQYRQVGGTVATLNDRLIAGGNGASTKYVLTFEGSGQEYGCTDTRCAAVRVGDDLDLMCIRAWQWTGVPGYDCEFVTVRSGGAS